MKAIFQLENGFNVFNGKLGQGDLSSVAEPASV